ncbi:class F sortase [Cellulomonas sp. DKR-3]|uniref:Class F sortase n=2 Tax=Cellulomonas fulva TaxID=2835530 RepID=A0ABS5TWS5_9CELL|nr:class F sortase [Cellulomonas fulva]
MAVVPVGVAPDGTMELPAAADVAGWYRYGPAPGQPSGNAVLAAHVDSAVTGLGPLVALRDVREASRLTVTTASGRDVVYSVTGVEQVPKTDAPLRSWFDRTGPAQLVVITCGGAWDAEIGHYSDNVVLTAEPVGR